MGQKNNKKDFLNQRSGEKASQETTSLTRDNNCYHKTEAKYVQDILISPLRHGGDLKQIISTDSWETLKMLWE